MTREDWRKRHRSGCAALDSPTARCTCSLVEEQAPPVPNDKPAVWDLVIADMQERDKVGRERYGTPLQPNNGRDALIDHYQELLDACVYARQLIYERDGR